MARSTISQRLAVAALVAIATSAGCHAEPDDPVGPKKGGAPPKPPPPPAECKAQDDPAISGPFTDSFDRAELGNDWNWTLYGAYQLQNGRVCTSKPRNHPLWLKRKLPLNVRVTFDATPLTKSADAKAELFGDGCSFDPDGNDYAATSYVAVLGAHNNSENWLARMFEHTPDVQKTALSASGGSIATTQLAPNVTYHVELSRTDGFVLHFMVNEVEILHYDDHPREGAVGPTPLAGPGHDHFAFNGWDASVCFDNLVITPL